MASMKPTLLIFTGLTVALALPAYADFSVGQRVPAPTAAGQSVTSTPTAPFTWTPVTLPYGLNATGQMAVGGTVDATTRLSVNPQGAAENGLIVNMPSGSTGKGIIFNSPIYNAQTQIGSGGGDLVITKNGSYSNGGDAAIALLKLTDTYSSGGAYAEMRFKTDISDFRVGTGGSGTTPNFSIAGTGYFNMVSAYPIAFATTNLTRIFVGANGLIGLGTLNPTGQLEIDSSSPSVIGAVIKAAASQTADMIDFNDNTNAVKAKVDKNFNATFPAVLTAISTKTAAYTLTTNDTTILVNGAFAVTLPAASAALAGHSWTVKQIGAASSTVVGTVDGNTGGYTLAAQFNFVTIICDGTNYWITGKG